MHAAPGHEQAVCIPCNLHAYGLQCSNVHAAVLTCSGAMACVGVRQPAQRYPLPGRGTGSDDRRQGLLQRWRGAVHRR